jgi:predicted DNA-binding transcriptional regulator AlpA
MNDPTEPEDVKAPPRRFINWDQLLAMDVGSRVQICRDIEAGHFPKPYLFGPKRPRFDLDEILAHINRLPRRLADVPASAYAPRRRREKAR